MEGTPSLKKKNKKKRKKPQKMGRTFFMEEGRKRKRHWGVSRWRGSKMERLYPIERRGKVRWGGKNNSIRGGVLQHSGMDRPAKGRNLSWRRLRMNFTMKGHRRKEALWGRDH